MVAYALALEAGRHTGTLVLPPIPFGVSLHHSRFPGTIWIREEIFREYVRDVISSLASYGVRKVIVVNGHGGNLQALVSLARELREKGVLVVVFQWWTLPELAKLFPPEELGHAAAVETSLNLYLHGEAVKMEAAVDEAPKRLTIDSVAYYPEYTHDRTISGVFGVSRTATREKGERIFRIAVEALAKLIEAVREIKQW